MSSKDIAVSVRGLSKSYTIRHNEVRHSTMGEALVHRLKNPFHRPEKETFWALKDVEFDVERGDVIGIIGRNGAGKSTLLKILSQITEPTTGEIQLFGRVGSLLEVGTGFHPELTGRENIYLNGAILGMRRSEIDRAFDAIVDFAGVEQFLDTPVKRYSSGMYVRLAFAVAAHLRSEILVVDEVLSVGDAEFQKKCMGKMSEVAHEGRTVLFVSHNMQAVSTLTSRCIALSGGRVSFDGVTNQAIMTYLGEAASGPLEFAREADPEEPHVTRVTVFTSVQAGVQFHGKPMRVKIEVHTPRPIDGAALSFQVLNSMQAPVMHALIQDSEIPMCREPGVYRFVCCIPRARLYIGDYTLRVHFVERRTGRRLDRLDSICPFSVAVNGEMRDYYWQPGEAVFVEDLGWEVFGAQVHEREMAATL